MGRQDFSCVGVGMTEAEAKEYARKEARDYSGHQEGYSGDINSATECHSKMISAPKFAKSCKVEKAVQKGARQWETVFVIEPIWGFSEGYNNKERAEVKTTQGDAIKKAKEMSLKFNKTFSVHIEKRLVTGDNKIAEITPKNSTAGKWKFWGLARC